MYASKLFSMIRIRKDRCPQNHPCPVIAHCPLSALSQQGNAAPEVDNDACISCGVCAKMCNVFELVD